MITVRLRPLELLPLLEPFCFRGPMASLGVGTSVSEYFFSFRCNAFSRRVSADGVSFFTTAPFRSTDILILLANTLGVFFNCTFFTGFVVGAGFGGFPVFIKVIVY